MQAQKPIRYKLAEDLQESLEALARAIKNPWINDSVKWDALLKSVELLGKWVEEKSRK